MFTHQLSPRGVPYPHFSAQEYKTEILTPNAPVPFPPFPLPQQQQQAMELIVKYYLKPYKCDGLIIPRYGKRTSHSAPKLAGRINGLPAVPMSGQTDLPWGHQNNWNTLDPTENQSENRRER